MTLQDRLRLEGSMYSGTALYSESADELDRLTAECERLRADAERYRKLRDVSGPTWRSFQEQWRMSQNQCDAAIDALP